MTRKTRILIAVLGSLLAAPLVSQAGPEEDAYYQYQLKRLFHPSTQQIQWERDGGVFIYTGLKASDVERALKEQGSRMDAMMFVKTIHTTPAGQPLTDPGTGQWVQDNDECDD